MAELLPTSAGETLRYERKLVPPGLGLPDVLALIRRHPAMFQEIYPERVVNNIYLDTPDLRHYHEHVQGTPNRMKVRLRWYGEFSGWIANPALEFKLRRGSVCAKRVAAFPAFGLNGRFPREVLAAAGRAGGAAQAGLHGLQPVLANRYRRRYFRSADRVVRLTVDWDLKFFDLRHHASLVRPVNGNGFPVIIELKFSPEAAGKAAEITRHFPFRIQRCSKYVIGVQQLGPVAAG